MKYKIRLSDGQRVVEKEIVAIKEYLDIAIDRLFRNKKFREELVKTFLIGAAEIDVTDLETHDVVGHGKFTTNVFSGRSDYQIKLY
jgi:hypothetical protein